MAVDTPARIAIIGAGPIGLETALYARYLGYDVDLYERGQVAQHVARWGHVTMFSPFGMNRSTLGLAALRAQDPQYQAPPDDSLLTGAQWRSQYLLPLAQSDLLIDGLRCQTRVLSVGRHGLLTTEHIGDDQRGDAPFRILIEPDDGQQQIQSADIVIDTSGVFGRPNWAGDGGIPAIGEMPLRSAIEYGLPDVLGEERPCYEGLHTLLIGSGFSAATTALALAQLAQQPPPTRLTWLLRRADSVAPLTPIPNDPLPARAALTEAAQQLVLQPSQSLDVRRGVAVHAIHRDGDRFRVTLTERDECLVVDRIVANVGYQGDFSICEQLHANLCYATGGPLRLAARLLQTNSSDCLQVPAAESDELFHPEPNFYILGAKSYGRNSSFLVQRGLDQIRALFQVIGDRSDLDLYSTMMNLL